MSRYKVNRIGFVNFWLYDEEDFYFYDGKLLLRGTNGSGKTVTMQSFFPLIFDGNKSPERLDPFGSRDRKIEDYLLPNDFEGNENTGYLYMEFFNKEENKYLTIGIGLRAIKNRNCDFWGFAITDNRRIGEDLLLFRERNLRITLTKKELQARIGTGGEVVESVKEYKKMVNRLLFGFPNLDLYTEYINLLIQVRSPKLSNSTKPSELRKILSSVLEPLSEDDLRTMADSIEEMNKYKEKLSDLKNEQKACSNLEKTYYQYNQALLYEKGERYLSYKQDLSKLEKDLKEKQKSLQELVENIKLESENIKNLELEQEELRHRKSKLEETDLKNISNQLEEITTMLNNLEVKKNQKETEVNQKEENLSRKKKELKTNDDELANIEYSFNELLKDLTNYNDEINVDDFKFYLDDLKKEGYNFKEITSYLNTVKRLLTKLDILKEISYRLYQKQIEIDNEKNSFEQKNDKLTETKKRQVEISNGLIETCDEFKNNISNTANENEVLKLDQDILNEIYQVIDNLEKDMFIKIKNILKQQLYLIQDKLKLEISDNNGKINEFKLKIEKLEEDLELSNDILINNLNDEITKKYFTENKINFKYLFETIKFKDNVDLSKQKQIESFLYDTGILTSFITNKDISDSMIKNKILTSGKITDNNLTKYLEPLNNEFKDKVLDILKSISIVSKNKDNNNSYVTLQENGNYNLAIITGHIDNEYELKYIGENVRENYIKTYQEKIKVNINLLNKEINNLEEENKNIENKLVQLNNEENNFIYPNEIPDYFKELDKINYEIENINDDINKLVDIIKTKTNELRLIQEELDTNKKGYYNSLNYEDILTTIDNIDIYLDLLKEIDINFKEYNNKNEICNTYKESINDINIDLDNLKLELDNLNYEITDYHNKKKTIDDILNSDKYKDTGREYQKIKERLDCLYKELDTKKDYISRNTVKVEYLEKDITELNGKSIYIKQLQDITYKVFIDEYNLHYIESKELDNNEIYNFIKSIKTTVSVKDAYEKFNDSSNKYGQMLIDYAPKNIYLHEYSEFDYLTDNDEINQTISNILNNAKRRDLVFNYLGKNVNLLDLSSAINSSINNYDNLISEENRKLFEDLLINNIGSSIRNKIWQSEEWINEVRSYMESMNTSSGLSFSLKWNGISAMTEDELDTKEIVAIFKQDAEKLKPEHLTKISNHFKSKIKMREELVEESERNYLEIIKDVLDYRKWFEFKLYYKRGNSEKKELTDREFNKMSGGEKAIAMYIPLFSSIYAKLNSANSNAPHVIALDEAFAGVDDNNINDAFRILDKLDIDYVLTSQQLWGDYETVKHLAISELHHPVGSNVVSVIKYKWDGINRSKVESNYEYQE